MPCVQVSVYAGYPRPAPSIHLDALIRIGDGATLADVDKPVTNNFRAELLTIQEEVIWSRP